MWAYLLFLAFSSTVTVSAIPTFDAKSGPGPVFSKRQNGELPGTCPSPANVKRQDVCIRSDNLELLELILTFCPRNITAVRQRMFWMQKEIAL